MRYGYFDDQAREYVVTNPDTPEPWTNYLGTRRYGAIITNNAAGYSYVESGFSGRLLRWHFNAVAATQPGRYLYLRDRASNDYWSTSWLPVRKPLDRYASECRHGTAYTVISSRYDDVATATTYYVPLEGRHEVWACTLTNAGNRPRSLSLFTYAELTNNDNAAQDMGNLQYSQFISRTYGRDSFVLQSINEYQSEVGAVSVQGGGNVAGPGLYRFVGLSGAPLAGFDGSREAFLGANRDYSRPIAVERGRCGGSCNYTRNSTGSMQVDLELQPGASRTIVVTLGPGGEETAAAVVARYNDTTVVARELADLKAYWHSRLERFSVQTPDAKLNSMVNTWNPYQCRLNFMVSRSVSLIYTSERNGYGFRDTVQDIQGILHFEPELAAERLRTMLGGQLSTGGALPCVRFDLVAGRLTAEEQAPRYRCDDALWLFPAVGAYLSETGDTALLDAVVPYADQGEDTVFGHLVRALRFSLGRLGGHGLVLGLEADWNDCIRLGDKGESTFASFQLYLALTLTAELAALKGKADDAVWMRAGAATLAENLARHAWEEDRFVRGFTGADGYVLGSVRNAEGKVFLTPQAWSVISGAASSEQGRRAMDTVHRDLSTDYGVMLCHPGFRTYGLPVMRAILFPCGIKENAAVFCHTQGWAILAEALLGRGDRAWEYYNNCNPARMNDEAEKRVSEPYVYSQFTEGRDSPYHGRSQNAWLTGSATTMMFAVVQGILGIRPTLDGLRIDPSIPAAWDHFTVQRLFRGRKLCISVHNPQHVEHGVTQVTVNGQAIAGNEVPLARMTAQTVVEVTMGKREPGK
jgi:N,N'-diacetylchitobiose phosphorylase